MRLQPLKGMIRRGVAEGYKSIAPARERPVSMSLQEYRLDVSGQAASDAIRSLLESESPCMIARFGSLEIETVAKYKYIHGTTLAQKIFDYLVFSQKVLWDVAEALPLQVIAGFFPLTRKNLDRFAELMIDEMPQVDLLGSWVQVESLFDQQLSNAKVCKLADIEPYYHPRPWSAVLEDKVVLVVHPFADSIERQYRENRKRIFQNSSVLPEFKLLPFKAVQSAAGNPTNFASWFDALDWMTSEINQLDFDIALIGCGAYGFPLAAKIKRMGRKAVHMGGATQYLFGIKAKRGESMPEIANLFNQYWVRPSLDERPIGFEQVEGGCYW